MNRIAGTILAVSLGMTLFWCGDVACLTEPEDDGCISLICSILGSNPMSSDEGGGALTPDCSCMCHTPTIPVNDADIAFLPPVSRGAMDIFFSIPASPSRLIYHPPLSA